MPDTRELKRILPTIIAALSGQRRSDKPIKVAWAPDGHIEAIVTLCDDGPVVTACDDEPVEPSRARILDDECPF